MAWFGHEVEIHRKKMKTMRLKIIPPEGFIRISAPHYLPEQAIFQFMQKNLAWIAERQAVMAKEKSQAPNFLQGEQHPVWGELFELDFTPIMGKPSIRELPNNKLEILAPNNVTTHVREKLLDEFYRRQLKRELPLLLEKWQPIVGKEVNEWGIKKMRTRWGTCNIQAKRIWLSLALAKKPKSCLEYVLVHELVHLHERYHNQNFKRLMTKFMPDWPTHDARLNQADLPDSTGVPLDL